MTTFIEFHALRSFPPSNLNRDDLGSPKTAVFGGSRRLRISSQCLKRTWRTSEHFRGAFAENQLGIRTDRMPEQVVSALDPSFGDTARQALVALLTSIGKKGAKAAAEGEGVGDEAEEGTANGEAPAVDVLRTPHLLFLSRQEIEEVIAFARLKKDKLAKAVKKKGFDADAMNKLRKDLEAHLASHTSKNAVDVALFGRFVTSDEIDTVEGALQVAHALGTQKVEVEYDYFTAVDDLSHEPGAGHLGESEYASSVLYLYACCDLAQLEKNLGARTKDGRTTDDEAKRLARQSVPALIRAIAEATPRGKKTGTAPYTPAEYVEVVVRRGAPLSYANAFLKPVGDREEGGDAMAASIGRLVKHRNLIETAYGRDADVSARLVLCLREVDAGSGANFVPMKSIAEVSSGLATSLNGLPSLP